jgi:hypothetical protein
VTFEDLVGDVSTESPGHSRPSGLSEAKNYMPEDSREVETYLSRTRMKLTYGRAGHVIPHYILLGKMGRLCTNLPQLSF